MQRLLGNLPHRLYMEFERHDYFKKNKLPQVNNPTTLRARYSKIMDDDQIDLIEKMLEMDPLDRITAKKALDHPYFSKCKAEDPDLKPKIIPDENKDNKHKKLVSDEEIKKRNESVNQVIGRGGLTISNDDQDKISQRKLKLMQEYNASMKKWY